MLAVTLMVLCDAATVCDRDCRELDLSENYLAGTIPKSFLTMKGAAVNMSHNLLTGNATLFVNTFGDGPFLYNCFDPAVPPSNPLC
jgi:hypothetical protein